MPNQQDQQAIDGLFDRIEDVARNSQPRDRDAEALIQQRLRDFPPAPYYMAQTILMQEEALRQAQERIEQLEAQSRPRGGFLGGLFNDEPQRQPARSRRGPWDRGQQDDNRGQGGGFLAGAAQTALGVTGGVLLGSAIAGMLTGGAHAQEHNSNQDQGSDEQDTGGDYDDGGGDFDIGGDF
ncbi:DUF2076 domain-containing protein [Devosia sp. SL43]|uniref:DUF2076 domain-containing protein n=1 Tax=Devosia sp. SL43 TaxID=2806348 RepID=UPI001F3DCE16|nr:DUF2076 domain-containing protein [Devosia sp. SL43]UJW86259.1 DUF2076 domain-containing protein [Devosia sp. SL43]